LLVEPLEGERVLEADAPRRRLLDEAQVPDEEHGPFVGAVRAGAGRLAGELW
jgi:hypothetical protein